MVSSEQELHSDRLTAVIASNAADLLAYFERRSRPEDAADSLAETMLAAWRRIADLPASDEQARMWLFGVARNVHTNADRSERRRWRLANRLRLMVTADAAQQADAGADVRDAVARLPPDLAELIRLVHWDGFTIAEAASVLGIGASTARSRHQKAKSILRAALGIEDEQFTPHENTSGSRPRDTRIR